MHNAVVVSAEVALADNAEDLVVDVGKADLEDAVDQAVGFEMGAATELMMLLGMKEVRAEVKLDDETWEAMSENRPDMREMFRASEEERKKMLKELNDNATAMLDEALAPTQLKRLMGLFVQQRGLASVVNELIADEIGLDKKGIAKVKEAQEKGREGMREKMMAMFRGGGEGGERPDRTKMMEMIRSENDKVISEALTADQKTKLEALKGEKFEFPEQSFGGRFGGGQAGGRGQGGRGGGRGQGGGRGGRPQGGRPGGSDN